MTGPEPAPLDVSPARPSVWRNLSFVWLVPILALALSLGLAWRSLADRGELIEITFANASGVTPGETELKYRDVVVGTVETVTFTDDLEKVLVRARVDKKVAPYLDTDTEFWVVRPQVTTRGVSGLSTVLSGVYIEGSWDKEVVGEPLVQFAGRDNPPLVLPGREGTRITLVATDGSLITEGAPVFFHGIEVGRLERPRLTVSSDAIVVDAFIQAPHDRRLNSATRFWDTSGFNVSISGAGLSVDFDSLSSLLAGGIAFDNVFEGGKPVSPGHVFSVYEDEASAKKSLLEEPKGAVVEVAAEFGETLSGLEPGADVRYGGIRVGQVTSIVAVVDDTSDGPGVRLMANLAIEPERLGLPAGSGPRETLDFLESATGRGLRARLATKNLFSAALIVELAEVPDAAQATFRRDATPLPVLPSVKSDLPDFTATAEGVLERINALPIEELLDQAIRTLGSIEAIATAEGTKAAPDAVVALLDDTRALVNDEATKALPGELRAAIADLRAVVSELREGGAVASLNETAASAREAAGSVAKATEGLPDLAARLEELVTRAGRLISAYGDRSDFNDETLAALREVRNAARSVSQLARAIERNPNSILMGR
ncbi:MAG: MCE family protein [Rhodobacteraceae bacterium]|nr:MCE family protein [Paracoccaceae bacterium]